MNFDFDMGKYAFYVWGAYGAAFLGLAGLTVLTVRGHIARRKELEALQAALKDKAK